MLKNDIMEGKKGDYQIYDTTKKNIIIKYNTQGFHNNDELKCTNAF